MFAGENTWFTEPALFSITVKRPTLTPNLKTCFLWSATSGTYSVEIRECIQIVASLIIIPCFQWADTAKLFKDIFATHNSNHNAFFPVLFLGRVFSVKSKGKCSFFFFFWMLSNLHTHQVSYPHKLYDSFLSITWGYFNLI